MVAAFREGLKETGFIEGQSVTIEFRWADSKYDQLPALAINLVDRKVTVIVVGSTPAALAAKAATTTIPIVFSTASDAVDVGLVASLNRPGGNLTGVSNLNVELGSKAQRIGIDRRARNITPRRFRGIANAVLADQGGAELCSESRRQL